MASTRNQNKQKAYKPKSKIKSATNVRKNKTNNSTPKKSNGNNGKPNVSVTIKTPSPKTGPVPHDLALGIYDDVFQTDQELKRFEKRGIMTPSKLILVKCRGLSINLANINPAKMTVRNLIYRVKPSVFRNMLGEGMGDEEINSDLTDITHDQMGPIVRHLEAELLKAKEHYKPTRIFIVIETHGCFGAILSFIARKNQYVQAVVNQVGKKQLSELTGAEWRAKFCKRLGYWLKYQHPYSRPLTEISDERVIVVGNL